MNYNDVQSTKEIYWKQLAEQRLKLLRELKGLTDVYYSYSPVSLEREEEILEEVEKELKNES